VETQARLEGRNMTMVLSPDKKAPAKKTDKDGTDAPQAESPAPAPTEENDNE
jgi:hypothetical protein